MRHYLQLSNVDLRPVCERVREAMRSSGLPRKVFAEHLAEELRVSLSSTQFYLSILFGGAFPGITMQTTSQEKRQVHLDRLSIILHVLRIRQDDPVILLLKEGVAGFSYPPTTTYQMQPGYRSPETARIASESSLERKIAAHNQKQHSGIMSLLDYVVLRAAVINTTTLNPSPYSEPQRTTTAAYAEIQAKIKAGADPYDVLPDKVEPAYPRELVKGVAEGLLLIVNHGKVDRRLKSTRLAYVLAGEVKRIFGDGPTLGSLVNWFGANIGSLETKLHELKAQSLVASLPDGAYVATSEGVMAYQFSPISRALFSPIPRKRG